MKCSWYFGDAADGLFSSPLATDELKDRCSKLAHKLDLQTIILLTQTHSTEGHVVNDAFLSSTNHILGASGDFLITKCKNVGIGVLTADCLPIVIIDPLSGIVAIVHAGWRGTRAHIVIKAIEQLEKEYNLDKTALKLYFGPAAGTCCYQVQPDFLQAETGEQTEKEKREQKQLLASCIQQREQKLFFDIIAYNKQLLLAYGIAEDQINTNEHCCTICNKNYCSYRRDTTTKRQITLAWIR
jgi:YfiH family protein